MARLVIHIIIGALLWIVFAYYWYLVFQRPVTDQTRFALAVVGTIVGAITLFLIAWIIHNIGIARRKGRRKRRLGGVKHSATDFVGRAMVMPDDAELRRADYIEVHVAEPSGDDDAGKKVFRPTAPQST